MKTMRAVVFYAPKDIRLVESPVPKPGAGEVLVKVGAALTCGTDFKAYRRGHPVLLGPLPARFGHELAGIVAQVGKGVKDFKEGDAVVAGNSAPCDGCYFCARGQNQLCDRLKLHNGAYADYDLLPPNIVKHNLHKLPSGIELATAALAEPLACAMHAVDLLKVAEGESALIIGAGSMSLLLIQALFARKARVLVVGRGRANLDLAQAAGAHDVFSVEDGDALTWRKARPKAAVRTACSKPSACPGPGSRRSRWCARAVGSASSAAALPAWTSRSTPTGSTTANCRFSASSITRPNTSRRPWSCSVPEPCGPIS